MNSLTTASQAADEVFGHWWLPDDSVRRVAGRLVFPPDGAVELELMDVLAGGRPDQEYPVLLGIASDGTPVTLEDLRWIGGHDTHSIFLDREHRRETFMVGAAYIGVHLPQPEDRSFSEGGVDFTDLLAWAGQSGFDERYGPAPVDVTIQLARPASREAGLDFGTISLNHGWRVTGDGLHARGVEKHIWFWAKLDQPADLRSWLSKVIGPLRHLMTFATDRRNEVRDLRFKTYRYSHHGNDVTVRYARGDASEATHAERIAFLFDADALGEDFERVLLRWFEIIEDIGPIIDLLLAQRYRPDVFAETRFLDAVGAAEAYHRARFANQSLPQPEHDARVAEIIDAVDARHRRWLRFKLKYSSEPSLAERLQELAANAPTRALALLPSTREFAGPVAKARNALIHDPRRRRSLTLTGRNLLRMTEQLMFLVSGYLLRDLGFDDVKVMEALRGTRRFRLLTEVHWH